MEPNSIDISATLLAKSDQLNADDLIGGEITVQVVSVSANGSSEQPVIVTLSGGHRPWKPCKTMRRVLVHGWGADAAKWIGRWLTLYREPSVKWGGEAIGGIRVSAMSHIPGRIEIALAETAKKKAKHVVNVLKVPAVGGPGGGGGQAPTARPTNGANQPAPSQPPAHIAAAAKTPGPAEAAAIVTKRVPWAASKADAIVNGEGADEDKLAALRALQTAEKAAQATALAKVRAAVQKAGDNADAAAVVAEYGALDSLSPADLESLASQVEGVVAKEDKG